jgi:hypothetical protein
MMKPKIRLALLACALGAAGIASAQTADIPPPSDVIRLPDSVTTPTMLVVVSPRDGQVPPLVRSLGAGSPMSDDDTLSDGVATGGGETTKKAATTGQTVILDSGDKPSDAGNAAPTDTSADSGAKSGTADTSNMAEQNKQADNATVVPAGIPKKDAPDNAAGASYGK